MASKILPYPAALSLTFVTVFANIVFWFLVMFQVANYHFFQTSLGYYRSVFFCPCHYGWVLDPTAATTFEALP
jgi:hypothetical protein